MPFATQCAHCHTVFRVDIDQIKVRQGLVRCGHCNQTFNAYATLSKFSDDEEANLSDANRQSAQPVDEHHLSSDLATKNSFFELPLSEPLRADEIQPIAHSELDRAALERLGLMADFNNSAQKQIAEPQKEAFTSKKKTSVAISSWRWRIACLILLVIALAQLIWINRTTLIQQWPILRTPFMRLCESLQCTVAINQPKLLSIESSRLERDHQNAHIFHLTLFIRNKARAALAYPYLVLSLKDERGRELVRRVLKSSDYLNHSQRMQRISGIEQGKEAEIYLKFNAHNMQSTNYRVRILT